MRKLKLTERMRLFFRGMACAFTITGDIPVRFSQKKPLYSDAPKTSEAWEAEYWQLQAKLQEEYWQLTASHLKRQIDLFKREPA